jgi:hypothetical protein
MFPLFVLVLPAHGCVRLFLTAPPGGDDCTLQRWMGLRDEALARGDMCDCAIHTRWCAPQAGGVTDEEEDGNAALFL